MTSPAQKAAGEICTFFEKVYQQPTGEATRWELESIIQQAITEAVDAAVATERAFWQKRIAELESNGTEEK